jgi:glucan 1,3-beta-glucosidase
MAPIFSWLTAVLPLIISTTRSTPIVTAAIAAATNSVSQSPNFIRGVNIGGWLVLEPWITPDVVAGTNAIDQWTFDSTPGTTSMLENHWSTFFTEADVHSISGFGLNAMRIPIGFWAYDNRGTPYRSGADAYLSRAVGWARSAGLKVWIDLHGAPGSQNGEVHSGHKGAADWQKGNNLNQTISILQTIASKYGTIANSDVVIGLELVNEPSTSNGISFAKTEQWVLDAYTAVRSTTENKKLQIIIHDSFLPASAWSAVSSQISAKNGIAAIDTHPYQLYTDADNALNQDQHVTKACAWSSTVFSPWKNLNIPTYAGEWSANTNVCINPDGSTLAGSVTATTCKVSGCQCLADTDSAKWGAASVRQVRRFVDAQLQTFEENSSGYFFWNWKGPSGWNFQSGVQQGWIPNPVTEYEKVC